MTGKLKERLSHFSEEAMLIADDANKAMVHRDYIAQSARELADGLAVVANNLPPKGGTTPTNRGGGKTAACVWAQRVRELLTAYKGEEYYRDRKDILMDLDFAVDALLDKMGSHPEAARMAVVDAPLYRMDEAHAGQAVQAARGAMSKPWTQRRLAGEAGINQSHLSKLERAAVPMTVPMLAHLFRRMGVITFEVRVQSGEFLVDGRVVRPATFDKFGRRTAKPSLERLIHD